MLRRLLRDPRRLQAAFVFAMVALAATLGWLGRRLIENENDLARSRATDLRETLADRAVAVLQQRLADWRQALGSSPASDSETGLAGCRDDCIVVRLSADGVRRLAGSPLLYSPTESENPVSDRFATAMLQSAGLEHSRGRYREALAGYDRLESRGAAVTAGMPAALAARAGRLVVHQRAGDIESGLAEARALARDLEAARWPVSYSTFKYLVAQARERHVSTAERLSDAATRLWDASNRDAPATPLTTLDTPEGPLLVVTAGASSKHVALIATSTFVERELVATVSGLLEGRGVRLALDSPKDGRTLVGSSRSAGERQAMRLAVETGLPWNVRIVSIDGEDPLLARRRATLMAGLGVLILFVLTGGWFVGRGVTRELEVARLKSEFVAAVSHEFRTPLTTIVQLSELLRGGRVAGEADRQAYYDLLHGEGTRLRRLVERLLNFGRIESGQAEYRLVSVDVSELVRSCVDEFRAARVSSPHELAQPDEAIEPPPSVRADREALGTVLWNLLENALKYSPDGGRIDVSVHRAGENVEIRVSDQGVGIPEAERHRIFEPFVRGAAARDRQIRGTGVGLSLARAIVRSHGGDLTVDSVVDRGSTFTVRLPGATV